MLIEFTNHCRTAGANRLFLAFALLCLLFPFATQAEDAPIVDQALKKRLIAALADHDGFNDRFDAEVWLVDMSQRLKKKLPNEKRRLELLKDINREANRANLPPELVLSVIQIESNFDRFAISEAGAQGLMQVMPFWLKELGRPNDNLFNAQTNLRFGCTILRYYLDKEKGNTTRALARYNGSLGSNRYPNLVFAALRNKWYR